MAFWKQVISQKYGEYERGGVLMRDRHGVGLWETIRKDCGLLNSRIFFLADNGQIVRF